MLDKEWIVALWQAALDPLAERTGTVNVGADAGGWPPKLTILRAAERLPKGGERAMVVRRTSGGTERTLARAHGCVRLATAHENPGARFRNNLMIVSRYAASTAPTQIGSAVDAAEPL